MSPDQVATAVNHTATALLAIMMAFGIVDSATSSQLVTVIGQGVTEMLALISTAGMFASIVIGIWRRTHPAQAKAAARSIEANPTADTIIPVVNALRAVGVAVGPIPSAVTSK